MRCLEILLILFILCPAPSFAQSPFVDQVPSAQKTKERALSFKPGVRVVLRSSQGVVIRGEMLSITNSTALIVPDRSRFKNPEGVDYKLDSLQSLTIPEVELKWATGDDPEKFIKSLSEQESLTFSNLDEFLASDPHRVSDAPNPNTTNPDELDRMSLNPKVITMQPAKIQVPVMPTVTIICGNCNKEVSLSSDSGQKCPHCNILWDTSPLDASELAALKAAEEAMKRETMAAIERSREETNEVIGMPAEQQVAAPPRNVANPGGAGVPQPVVVPPPIQNASQSQELTLENMPVWMKFAIFSVCLGALYYTFFYVR